MVTPLPWCCRGPGETGVRPGLEGQRAGPSEASGTWTETCHSQCLSFPTNEARGSRQNTTSPSDGLLSQVNRECLGKHSFMLF